MRLYGSPECADLWRVWTAATDRCFEQLARWAPETDPNTPSAQAAYRDLNNARRAAFTARNAVIDQCRLELGSPPATYGAALVFPDHVNEHQSDGTDR